MIKVVYKQRRLTALFFLTLILTQMLLPTISYALTSGPAQPETQSFTPAGTSDMVDLFSGDFSYNIPLFELPGPNGGYPFNLSYQSGIGMDQEASWVGLGFSLNPGAINRQMRGLPDEFKGDAIYTKTSISPSVTVGLGVGVSIEVLGSDNISLGVGFSVNQNNYKGLGYSIDGSLGYTGAASSGMTAGIGMNFSIGSNEGVNANASLSLDGKLGNYGMGAGYNSKTGLNSISFSHELSRVSQEYKKGNKNRTWTNSVSESTELTFSHPGYTPQVSMPMRNVNLSAKFKAGGAWWGVFGSPYVTGFYNEQWLKNDKKRVRSNAYGYMNYQYAANTGDVLDFNREKDGIVMKESPNLPIPSLTYDIYSVSGQGISAMYRPMRNDFGIVRDPETTSVSVGGSAGVDVGPATSHVGVNLSVNHAKSTSGTWSKADHNLMAEAAGFRTKKTDQDFEPWYFKAHGEPTPMNEADSKLDSLGGDDPVRVNLDGDRSNPKATKSLEKKKGNWSRQIPGPSTERKLRNQVIQTITNEELINDALVGEKNTLVSFFKVRYINETNQEQFYDRAPYLQQQLGHHIAGLTALTPEGLRYNYGIPAYNLRQEEVTFTAQKKTNQVSKVDVENTDQDDPKYDYADTEKFLKRVEMPSYAHSYLLTSIVGPDYVDVSGDGVTVDDLGYWVNFTYKRTSGGTLPYKWRDPYEKAHLNEGWKTDPRDDKGSFVYGEKEMWYLAKAETRSHISTFSIEARLDGRGVKHKMRDANNKETAASGAVYALKEVKLFARSSGQINPIKVVKFEYDYSRCPNILNGSTGKLTLKKLWFEYGKSIKGRLNPYVFSYDDTNNPSYDQLAYDRWGNYKPYSPNVFDQNRDFPYVDQNPNNKDVLDRQAASWSLNEIKLPSGGKIMVDYESDDYGYVQHLPAMQMMEIVDPVNVLPSSSDFNISDDNLKVRFKLEKSIPYSAGINQRAEVLKYIDQRTQQLYFKILINLRTATENFHEYVCGYADIAVDSPMTLERANGNGDFVYGTFFLKAEDNRHPFSMRAWQHLRTNQPDLANSGRKLKQTTDTKTRIKQIRALGSVVTQVKQMYKGFYAFCSLKGWGRMVKPGKSWIRLNSPDKIKHGGGLRVRQITMKDNWKDDLVEDEEGVYGQVYEYTTKDGETVISSGVAAYEPLVGGDENPLRYAKKYAQAVPLRADNNMFFEYPVNESYYPGPQVGYSKVTVTSLAAASLMGTITVKHAIFPKGAGVSYGTTGMTVHEFYTAKDFPVIADETEKANKPYKLTVPVPLLGNIAVSKLTTSQGYSIITNDMHGKLKQVSNYRQTEEGTIDATPISWVKYSYLSKQRIYQRQNVSEVSAHFKIGNEGTLQVTDAPDASSYSIGQENEFFLDMRQYEDKSWVGGANINIDVLMLALFPLAAPTVWPNISKTTQQLRMATANKIIFKSGILESVEAYDGGSKVITKNLRWDKLTGAVVLSQVNNNFDKPVYSYNIPAHTQYQGMGAAYKNIGLTFFLADVKKTSFKNNLYEFTTPELKKDLLFPGDEIMLYDKNGSLTKPLAKVIYNGDEADAKILYSVESLTATEYYGMIVRSGYRNQLSVSAGTITALTDPSQKGETKEYSKTISVPRAKTGN